MGLSRQTGHVGSAVVQRAFGGEGAAEGKRFVNGVCWWVCAGGVGGQRLSGVRSRGQFWFLLGRQMFPSPNL